MSNEINNLGLSVSNNSLSSDILGVGTVTQSTQSIIQVLIETFPFFARRKAESIREIADANSYASKKATDDLSYTINEIHNVLVRAMNLIHVHPTLLKEDSKELLYALNLQHGQSLERFKTIKKLLIKSEKFLSEEISNEGGILKEKVDPNWGKRFFNIAQDISDENMQELWSKILAGEISQPGSFSLRSLEVLKNMSQKEAILFRKLCALSTNNGLILNLKGNLSSLDLQFSDLFDLSDAGVLTHPDPIGLAVELETGKNHLFEYKNFQLFLIWNPQIQKPLSVPIMKLTRQGVELSKLIADPANNLYIEKIKLFFQQEGHSIQIIPTTDKIFKVK